MKKFYVILSVLLVLSFALTACGAKATPVPPTTAPAAATKAPAAAATKAPAAQPAGEAVTITYWDQEGDDVEVLLDELGDAFMKANPNITIERVHFGNEELRDQFQTASLAGEAPELVRSPNDFAGPFSELEIVKPISTIYDQAFLDQFFPGALGPAMVKGTLWGVPDNYGNHLMLLYNKKLVSEVPADTDAWIAQLKTLTDENAGQYGLAYNLTEPFWLAPWLGGFGGWPLNDQDQPTLGSQAMVDALQFVHDLKFVDKVVPQEADYNTAETLFKEGNVAYLINGDWSLGGYKDTAGLDFGVTAMPKVSKTGLYPSPMTSGKYWFFSKDAKGAKLEAAKKFVAYMTSAEVQQKWLEKMSRLPSNQEVAKSDLIKTDPILKGSMEQLSHGRGMPAAPEMRCAWDAMRPNLEGVMSDSMTPADAAKAMQADAEKCVAEMKGAATPTAKQPEEKITEPVTITYWDQEGDDVEVLLDELNAEFMKANPNVTIERVHFGNEEERDQFQTASLAGEAPELVRSPNDFAGPFSELEIIKSVKDIYDQQFLDQFFPGALGPAVVKGTLWGVPDNYGNHLMLLYNKKLVSEVPADTDAWIAQLKTLTDENAGQYGLAYNLTEPFWLAPWLGGFGGWPLDDQDQPTLGSQAMVDALQFVHDLKFVDKVVPQEADYNTAETLFKEGNAAYLINGDWSLGGYKSTAGLDFGVTAMPKVSKTGLYPSPMTSGKYWFFSKDVQGIKLVAAKKFVAYMTSAEVQQKWLEQFSRLPSNQEVAKSDLIKTDPILKGSMEQLSHGRGMPAAPEMRCAWDAMRPNLEGVMSDSMTPADAAKAMQDDAAKCVAEMKGK